MLNPDTVVRDGGLIALLRHMEAHRDIGIAGSRLEDPDGTPQCSAFRFPGIESEIVYGRGLWPFTRLLRRWQAAPPVSDVVIDVDWVAGARFESRRRYYTKNHGVVYTALADVAFAISLGLYQVRRAILRVPDTFPAQLWHDHVRHSILLRGRG